MNHLEPRSCHPHLWILVEILGLTLAEVAESTGISRPTLRRMREGAPPTPRQLQSLAALVERVRDQIAAEMSPPPAFTRAKPPRPFCFWHLSSELHDWRRRTFDLINHLLRAYAPTPPAVQPRSDLGRSILACLGTAGAPRSRVLATLAGHKGRSVRRSAESLGVREVVEDGRVWWLPPRDLKSVVKPPPPPQVFRQSPRARRIQTCLETHLARADGPVLASDAIAHVVDRTGCSRVAVFRAAKELCVARDTTGFGASKVTRWSLILPDAGASSEVQE